jgi:hypothetical protein
MKTTIQKDSIETNYQCNVASYRLTILLLLERTWIFLRLTNQSWPSPATIDGRRLPMNERMLDDLLMNSRKELKKNGKEYEKAERV